jgi:hypothetical protein
MPFTGWFLDIAVVTGIGLKNGIEKKMKLTDIGFLLVFPRLRNGTFNGFGYLINVG